jgi:tetratricopeptide (TPR) repeat protein
MNKKDIVKNNKKNLPKSKKNQRPGVKSKELKQSEHLMTEGKYQEALLLLNDFEGKQELTDSESLLCYLFKSSCLNRTGNHQEAFKFAEKAYQICQELNSASEMYDIMVNLAWSLNWLGDLDKSFNFITQAEELKKKLSHISPLERDRKEAEISFCKGCAYFFQGDADQGLECARKSLELRKKREDKFGIALSLYQIGGYYTFLKWDFDQALKYAERCQSLAEELNIGYIVTLNFVTLGVIYIMKGELEKALMYHKRALDRANEKYMIMSILNNIGNIYIQKGDLDQALKYLEDCLELAEQVKNRYILANSIGSIIEILVLKNEVEKAQKYLKKLEYLNNQEENKITKIIYLFSKALILKASPRIQNRAKAQEIFEKITQGETISGEVTIKALINRCALLFDELWMTQELEILNELEPIIIQLLRMAENTNSFWILAETHILRAKLALLTLDLKGARRLLTQAQKIAEKHGMHRLAAKISIEHDELLQKSSIWEKLKDSESSLSERFKLTNVNEQMKNMIQKRISGVPEILEEKPVIILVISKGGIPIFSKLFTEILVNEEDIISSFLATFNTFSSELFSEGLDRAIFGQYTLLMKSISTFLVCYLFKGQSFSAQKKIQNFVENIKNNEDLLEKFNKYYQTNRIIKLEDVPILKSLITEIFIEKNI